MGINIGDLSTVLLSSVPPGTANFQQRIGRAGRRDGNAFVGAIANSKPHDLFFYANPIEMLGGKIEAAGCYLDASAILQRQLTAFCLDSWIATGVTRQAFPSLLSDVLNAIERTDQTRFPHNWLTFIQEHQGELLAMFLKLFEDTTAERTRDELRIFMEKGQQDEGGLRFRILHAQKSHGWCRPSPAQAQCVESRWRSLLLLQTAISNRATDHRTPPALQPRRLQPVNKLESRLPQLQQPPRGLAAAILDRPTLTI